MRSWHRGTSEKVVHRSNQKKFKNTIRPASGTVRFEVCVTPEALCKHIKGGSYFEATAGKMTEATARCSRSKVPQLYESQQIFFLSTMSRFLCVNKQMVHSRPTSKSPCRKHPDYCPCRTKKACRHARIRLPPSRTQQMCGSGQHVAALLDRSHLRYISAETGNEGYLFTKCSAKDPTCRCLHAHKTLPLLLVPFTMTG